MLLLNECPLGPQSSVATNMVQAENTDQKLVSCFGSSRQGKLPHAAPEPQRPGLPPQANPVPKLAREGGKRDLPNTLVRYTPNIVQAENTDQKLVSCFGSCRQGKPLHAAPEPQRPGRPPQANLVPKLAREGGRRDLSNTVGRNTPNMVQAENTDQKLVSFFGSCR